MLASLCPNISPKAHVVAIGGGHGLGRVLSALNFLEERLTGIVTTTDNGGSTGRIRTEQGGIAWGDLRNCLNQIIVEPSTASKLFEYRFAGKGDLKGHNLGNLMLKALENMQIRPTEGVNLIRDLLKVKSFIIPMSEQPVHLAASLTAGASIVGEVSIDQLDTIPSSLFLVPLVQATPEAIQAIQQADIILLGPGSFFTSILPPLLLPEIIESLKHSKAKKIFIDNLAVEQSMAAQLSLLDRIEWIHKVMGKDIINGVLTEEHCQQIIHQPNIKCLTSPLRADDVTYRHDRELLCKGLDQLIELLN